MATIDVTDPTKAAATTSPRLTWDRCPRILGLLLCPFMVEERSQLREAAGKCNEAEVTAAESATAVGPDALLDSGSEARASRGLVGS